VPYTTLISTSELAEALANPGPLCIVDCRYDLTNEDWGRGEYRAGHIPGAVYASLSRDMAGPRTGRNGRHPLPTVEAMAATFSNLGIGAGTQVVAYDQESGMYASRLWWMLRYLGHEAVAVLDGGWAKWTREQRPTSRGDETREPAAFTPRTRPEQLVDVQQMERLAREGSALLLDARSPERFEGRVEPIDRVPGHIPGARNLYHRDNVTESGTLTTPEAIKARFEQVLERRVPADVVMYCGSGVTACHNLLAMEHAGLRGAKLYPGSWSEWSSDPERPVETGSATRP
jgi:thiosulfate/3-mercaptopyruvate sulfurtransferase